MLVKLFLWLVPEKYLLNVGIWDEIKGEPMNLEALEFDRRNSSCNT